MARVKQDAPERPKMSLNQAAAVLVVTNEGHEGLKSYRRFQLGLYQ